MRRTASENAFWYRILPWIIGVAAVFSASSLLMVLGASIILIARRRADAE